jgi:hypothetical protein
VTLNALDREAEIDYVRERSRRGHKSGYGKRWRLKMRLKRRLDISDTKKRDFLAF